MFANTPASLRQRTGLRYEALALNHLRQQGLKLVSRNYHCRMGEIDLIMQDGEYLVFVEVRFREQSDFGLPVESISNAKQKKLRQTASHYLLRQGLYDKVCCRFDVVGVSSGSKGPDLHWIRNAFQ